MSTRSTDFQVLTYRGKSLAGMSADELRGVVDDMAETYRRRLRKLRAEVERIARNADAISRGAIFSGVDFYRETITGAVKKLCVDLDLDGIERGEL